MTFFSQECQTEMLAHQASLDYVNQPLQTCSTDEGHRGRYEHKQFAEEQGRLNHQWLSLQETLNSQVRRQTVTKQLQIKVYVNLFLYPQKKYVVAVVVCGVQIQEVEQELRSRTEREARLQQISSWITDQNLWIVSAQTPSSQTELQRSISTCQVRGHMCNLTPE